MTDGEPPPAGLGSRVTSIRERAMGSLAGQVWERMLEIEFVDRSVALAGKAFVSFFPLVIVVAAFMPPGVRQSIISAMVQRLGMGGAALTTVREAFASTDDIRRATGLLGLVITFFFASSFTTAVQRVYLRAWRRSPGRALGTYTRGPTWLAVLVANLAILGWLRGILGDGAGFVLFAVLALAGSAGLWWFTAWFLLMGQVRWRVLLPGALITGLAMSVYALAASVWMPEVVARNQAQFGFFGVALALVTWFSGAAICILVGACAGPVLAEDTGPVGIFIRGREGGLLAPGAPPSLPAPTRALRLRDAFSATEDDVAPTEPPAGEARR